MEHYSYDYPLYLEEKYRSGAYPAGFYFCANLPSPSQSVDPPHSHPFVEMILITEGSASILLNQTTYSLKKGDLVLIPAGIQHVEYSSEPYTYNSVHLENYRHAVFSDYIFQTKDAFESLISCFRLCRYELSSDKRKSSEIIMSGFSAMLHILEREIFPTRESSEPLYEEHSKIGNSKALTVKFYIDCHYMSSSLTLEKIAELIYVSKEHLIRIYKKMTGYTPLEYLTLLRLQLACRILLRRDDPVQTIYASLGFKTYDSFLYAFKKQFGCTPLQFRQEHANEADEYVKKTTYIVLTKSLPKHLQPKETSFLEEESDSTDTQKPMENIE